MIKVAIEVDPLIHAALGSIARKFGTSRSEIIRNAMYWVVSEVINGPTGELPQPAPQCTYQIADEKRVRMYNGLAVMVNEWGLVSADQSKAPRTITTWEELAEARGGPQWSNKDKDHIPPK